MIKTEEKKVVLKAIDELGRRVTPADVATKTGLPILVATSELNKVAAEANGHLEVSTGGDIAYRFNPGFQNAYLATGLKRSLQQFGEKAFHIGFMILKASFGVMLILSFLAVIVLIIAVILAMNTRDNDRDGGFDFNFDFFDYLILRDLLWWGTYNSYRPYIDYSQPATTRPDKPNFLTNCFSFLFGDGDPNAHLEERQWQLAAQAIRKNNGVVTAEQMAPYTGFDPKNEDGILPTLVRFNGNPEVTEDGHILYTFPSLQVSAAKADHSSLPAFLREFPRQFTQADFGDLMPVLLLAGFNFLGSWWLLAQSTHIVVLARFHWLIVVLVVYGTFFVTVPLIRWLWLQYMNSRIEARNAIRKAAADLMSTPAPDLSKKLAQAAERRIKQTQIGQKDVIYTTEKDMLEQEFEPPGSGSAAKGRM